MSERLKRQRESERERKKENDVKTKSHSFESLWQLREKEIQNQREKERKLQEENEAKRRKMEAEKEEIRAQKDKEERLKKQAEIEGILHRKELEQLKQIAEIRAQKEKEERLRKQAEMEEILHRKELEKLEQIAKTRAQKEKVERLNKQAEMEKILFQKKQEKQKTMAEISAQKEEEARLRGVAGTEEFICEEEQKKLVELKKMEGMRAQKEKDASLRKLAETEKMKSHEVKNAERKVHTVDKESRTRQQINERSVREQQNKEKNEREEAERRRLYLEERMAALKLDPNMGSAKVSLPELNVKKYSLDVKDLDIPCREPKTIEEENKWFTNFLDGCKKAGASLSDDERFLKFDHMGVYTKVACHDGVLKGLSKTIDRGFRTTPSNAARDVQQYVAQNKQPAAFFLKAPYHPAKTDEEKEAKKKKTEETKEAKKKGETIERKREEKKEIEAHFWPIVVAKKKDTGYDVIVKDCSTPPTSSGVLQVFDKRFKADVHKFGPSMDDDMCATDDSCSHFAYKFASDVISGKLEKELNASAIWEKIEAIESARVKARQDALKKSNAPKKEKSPFPLATSPIV